MNEVKVYFTCGQNHFHPLGGGKTWDRNGIVEVISKDYGSCIELIQCLFGNRWANDYPESDLAELLKYCPSGVVASFKVMP